MTWNVRPPTVKESCYGFAVGKPGAEMSPAYLTYRLTGSGAPRRDLLLVRRNEAIRLPRLLSDRDWARLNNFEGQLRTERAERGNIGVQKSVVNRVYEGQAPFDELVVAVHRLGPIPAYVLPDRVRIEVHDEVAQPRVVDACVGVYQEAGPLGEELRRPAVYRSRYEFLSSLRDLPTLFRRYYEDISELLFDIQHHLPLHDVPAVCKTAFSEIRQSIDTKVHDILHPERYEESEPPAAELARRLAVNFADSIRMAECYRALVFSLLYRLLRMFCIHDEVAVYEGILSGLVHDGDADPGERAVASTEYGVLRHIARMTLSNDPELSALRLDASLPAWLMRVLEFARFVVLLECEGFVVSRPSIFLSAQNRLTSPALLRQFFVERLGDQLKFVEETAPGTTFLPLITSRIWQSESTLAVVPRERAQLDAGGEPRKLTWLVQEIDYADMLEKHVIAVVERPQRINDILGSLTGESIERLVVGLRPKPDRRTPVDTFTAAFDDRVVLYYDPLVVGEVDANLADKLAAEHRRVLDRRTQRILPAFLRYIAKDNAEVGALKRLHKHTLDKALKIEDLAPKVFLGLSGSAAIRSFTNLMKRVHERPVKIENTEVPVAAVEPGTRRYRTNLPRIVRLLRPDLTDDRAVKGLLHDAFGRIA
jgi:hypothetical protein